MFVCVMSSFNGILTEIFLPLICLLPSASIMESKKLLILASIRQPLVDHSNKVTELQVYFYTLASA